MLRTRQVVLTVMFLLSAGFQSQASDGDMVEAGTAYRGVAVLASEIGKETQAKEIVDLCRECRLNLVVVDFAWITHHWPKADQKAIRSLIEALRKQDVHVAMMYRPRALRPADAPIHYALDEDGKVGESHNELCFAHQDSVDWAIQWGVRIRSAFPKANQIILYNLRPACHCPECRNGKAAARISTFLGAARKAWQKSATGFQIGHVGIGDEYLGDVEFLCPFLAVNRMDDSPPDWNKAVARLVELKSGANGKPVIPLLKVCWESQTNNRSADVAGAIRACDAAGTGFILWYYEWIFHSSDNRYDPNVVVAAMKGDAPGRAVSDEPKSSAPNDKPPAVTPELKALLGRCRTDPAAIDEAARAGEAAVAGLAAVMLDKNVELRNRWMAANALGSIRSRRAVQPLLQALKDPDQGVRRCAAGALGLTGDPAARPALQRLAQYDPFTFRDPNTGKVMYLVRDDARKALKMLSGKGGTASPPSPRPTGVPALKIPETQPSLEKLPWPHQAPGLSPAEVRSLNDNVWVVNDFSLYQADEKGEFAYLHGGLDIVLDNGERIYAMKDGWVKSIQHSTITIADQKDGRPGYGWEYTHLGNFQVQVGQFVKRGTWIGEVDFQGLPHLHLTKVYSQGDFWGEWRYQCMPNGHFEYTDTQPPVIVKPFHFLQNKTKTRVEPDAADKTVLAGQVDIVVGMRDPGEFAHSRESGFGDRLGLSRIEWEVRPAGQKKAAGRTFKSFDFEHLAVKSSVSDRTFNSTLAKTVYAHSADYESKPQSGNKNISYCLITNCPQNGDRRELKPAWAGNCWDTTAKDSGGRPVFPDGEYELTVRVWDFKGNKVAATMNVMVKNQ